MCLSGKVGRVINLQICHTQVLLGACRRLKVFKNFAYGSRGRVPEETSYHKQTTKTKRRRRRRRPLTLNDVLLAVASHSVCVNFLSVIYIGHISRMKFIFTRHLKFESHYAYLMRL